MTTGDPNAARDRRLTVGIFALLFASYAYFYQGGGWNENSRMDLVRALVEHRSFSIDAYHENTGDKALFRGHYYSDKAPGVSLLGAPVYALVLPFRGFFSTDHDFVVVSTYVVTMLTVGALSAALGALLFRTARLLGAGATGSTIAALGYGLGTIAFPLSTMLFSHQVAAFLLVSAFYLARSCKEHYTPLRSAFVGLCCAAAVLVEFPAAIATVVLTAYHFEPSTSRRRVALFAAGLGVPAVLLAGYLWTSFGSPLRVGYDVLSDPGSRAEMHARGLFGITHPKIGVIVELLIGRFRGLIPYSPLLILALFGFAARQEKRARVTFGVLLVAYLLFVSSYEWWQGGASFGSRHLALILPFWVLPLAWVADHRPKLSAAAVVVSMSFMTIVTAVQPKPGEHFTNPFWGEMVPRFLRGSLPASNVCTYTGRSERADHRPLLRRARHDSFNFGMVLGGSGHRSLIPLYALWATSAWAFARTLRRDSKLD